MSDIPDNWEDGLSLLQSSLFFKPSRAEDTEQQRSMDGSQAQASPRQGDVCDWLAAADVRRRGAAMREEAAKKKSASPLLLRES